MEKQPYTKPMLAILGDLATLTQGPSGTGEDDITLAGAPPVSPPI